MCVCVCAAEEEKTLTRGVVVVRAMLSFVVTAPLPASLATLQTPSGELTTVKGNRHIALTSMNVHVCGERGREGKRDEDRKSVV